jgi:hypothetical protein
MGRRSYTRRAGLRFQWHQDAANAHPVPPAAFLPFVRPVRDRKPTMKTSLAMTLVAFSVAGLAACDVEKTQEGNITMPKYEVEKTQQGDVTLPKYDVQTPDVKVTTEPKVIEVPKIEIEPAK